MLVTGISAGSTKITGTLGNGMSVTINVTVEIIPLTDFELSLDKTILKGKEYNIGIKAIPEDTTELENITYTSSDKDVLTVDNNGVVKGLKKGTATITVKIGNISKEIEVTVEEINAEEIVIEVPNTELEVGSNMNISVSLKPENATDELTYTYESSDPSVATVDEFGNIVALNKGTTDIKVIASNGLTSTITINVTGVVVSPNTGLESYVIYLALGCVSLIGIGAAFYLKKKFKN